MADEQYHWLDPETAERLLRGEPLDTVDETVRDQAERLAAALYALAAAPQAEPSSADGAELPGEAAALAAFRKARAEEADAGAVRVDRVDAHAHTPAGIGRFRRTGRIGRTRRNPRAGRRSWGRPLHLAVSAALAAGAVGGVAAATTGVLPTPFGGGEPTPAASVSDRATPDGPSASSSPDGSPGGVSKDTQGGVPGASTPGGAAAGPSGADAGNTGRDGDGTPATGATAGPGGGQGAGSGDRWSRLASDCRDLRDGKALDADRKHVLEGAAGGSSRVWTYCKGVLKTAEGRDSAQQGGGSGRDGNDGGGKGHTGGTGGTGGKGGTGGTDGGSGQDGRGGKGGQGGQGGDDDGGHIGGGRTGTDAAGFAPARPPLPAQRTPAASPTPTVSPAETAAPAPTASPAAPASPATPTARP
ncbi:extensin [Streptomyces sp. NPDC006393]|uniref:extensin n=1 Tax=Streptomyces sp. NPDC006393 TaxID=3156763 RepID=UPI0033F45B3B